MLEAAAERRTAGRSHLGSVGATTQKCCRPVRWGGHDEGCVSFMLQVQLRLAARIVCACSLARSSAGLQCRPVFLRRSSSGCRADVMGRAQLWSVFGPNHGQPHHLGPMPGPVVRNNSACCCLQGSVMLPGVVSHDEKHRL